MRSTWARARSSDSTRRTNRPRAGLAISSASAARFKRGGKIGGFDTVFAGDVPLGAGMSSSAALESTYAFALNDLYGCGIDKFELAKIGQSTEHNYCGVNCGIMDQFASVFGKKGNLIRLDCRSLEYAYFPFDPKGYKLVLLDSRVKHELVGSPYNDRRASCERVAKMLGQEFLRGATMEQLDAIKDKISRRITSAPAM